jgi:uncharacterized protein YjbI with pentapeptide repeats
MINLTNAVLIGANLNGADLIDTKLICANLNGADLIGITLENYWL